MRSSFALFSLGDFMLISRRSALACASALTACTAVTFPAAAHVATAEPSTAQRLQHLLIHRDEAGVAYSTPLPHAAPDTAWATSGLLDELALERELASRERRGYGLRRLSAFQTKDGVRHAAVWQLGRKTPALVRHGMTQAQFRRAAEAGIRGGLAMVHVDACTTEAGVRFAAIWERTVAPAEKISSGLTAEVLAHERAALAAGGYQPRQIAGYELRGEAHFAVVFAKRAARQEVDHAIAAEKFRARDNAMRARGYALREASGYVAGDFPFVAAIWENA